MQMKNYKKTGNKETFDIYHKGQGEDMGSVERLIDPNLKVVDDLSKQYIIINSKMYNDKIRLGVVSEGQNFQEEIRWTARLKRARWNGKCSTASTCISGLG